MITRIAVKNFKSLVDFELTGLGKLVCLVGINGSGKTTFLQLLSFIRALMRQGGGRDWFHPAKGDEISIAPLGTQKRSVEITIDFSLPAVESESQDDVLSPIVYYRWFIDFNTADMIPTIERLSRLVLDADALDKVEPKEDVIMRFQSHKLSRSDYQGGKPTPYPVVPTSSILSVIKTENAELIRVRDFLAQIRGVGVLNPSSIASASKFHKNDPACEIEEDGRNLPTFLSHLSNSQMEEFSDNLRKFYGDIESVAVKGSRFGWKRIIFRELSKIIDAQNMSSGTLRFMVLAAMKYSAAKILYFDEIENGFNQEVMKLVIDLLLSYSDKQVFVTTHSALFLNYIPEEIAKKSICLFYKTKAHQTCAAKIFEALPELGNALTYDYAGQILLTANLNDLADRLNQKG